MTLVRIATTPWLRTASDLRALGALVGTTHRVLGAIVGPSLTPELSGRLPLPGSLTSLVRALAGRIVVTNPCAAARLPRVLGPLARAALRRALLGDTPVGAADANGTADRPPGTYVPAAQARLRDARDAADERRLRAMLAELPDAARDALAPGGATWAAAALYEPTTLDVRFADGPVGPSAPEPHPLVAAPRYRLALVLGAGDPPAGWADIDAAARTAPAIAWPSATAEPLPWFAVRVLVPDAVAARGMDPATLARWGALTGRGGPSSRDSYWYAETWERFREPGRVVGCITPALVARSRRTARHAPPAAHGWEGGGLSAVSALTPAAEQGICVPPGYALVDCDGTLELTVVRA